jgi:hypothetical protein
MKKKKMVKKARTLPPAMMPQDGGPAAAPQGLEGLMDGGGAPAAGGMAKGGKVGRGDGIAQRGRTKGKMI